MFIFQIGTGRSCKSFRFVFILQIGMDVLKKEIFAVKLEQYTAVRNHFDEDNFNFNDVMVRSNEPT